MAKQQSQRRVPRSGRRPGVTRTERPLDAPVGATPAVVAPRTTRPGAITAPAKSVADFASEYFYVYSDLRRIGILAACLLAGLVILSFVIG